MNTKIRTICAALSGFLAALCLSLLMLSLLLEGAGTSAPLMEDMFLRYAPSEETGLPEEEYRGMAEMVTGYLAGSVDDFQYTLVQEDGTGTLLFNPDEQQHMADCRGLFVLDRTVLLISGAALCLLFLALLSLKRSRSAARGFACGAGLVMLLVAGLSVWGCIDFNGLFIRFHQLSFSNGLWMMNPEEDLIIRLMPLPFFIHYAAVIGAAWIAGMLIALGGGLYVALKKK